MVYKKTRRNLITSEDVLGVDEGIVPGVTAREFDSSVACRLQEKHTLRKINRILVEGASRAYRGETRERPVLHAEGRCQERCEEKFDIGSSRS